MPFDRTYRNPHLVNNYLTVRYAGKNMAVDLDTCLSISNGKLIWGGRGGFSALRNQTLSGSDLTGLVEFRGERVEVHLDLSTNIMVKDGRLIYVSINSSSPDRDAVVALVSPSADLLPSYEASFAQEFRTYKLSHVAIPYSAQNSSFFRFSVGNSLALVKSVLHATCRKAGERDLSPSSLDLDPYIGIVDGRLVWGRVGFYTACKYVKLEGFILHAQCEDNSKKQITSTLDLSRYLYVYNGLLSVKVETGRTRSTLSTFFTEAPWLKFKVVTETDSEGVLRAVGQSSAFKTAFGPLAEATYKDVIAESTQEYYAFASEYLRDVLNSEVETQISEVVADAIGTKVREELTAKIKVAFEVAQEAVITACNEMVDGASNDAAVSYTESVVRPMQDQIIRTSDVHMQTTVAEACAAAIALFQERAEILMEKELVGASVRRAQTHARLLEMLTAHLEEGALRSGF
ncbi:hypothetical protein GYMLUDRAFT_47682 [Collybiopsis luxurians FD-317 M1]|uniref:Cyanovirin-N domain-containing protein n=1 Tax=Collybiopsis luxurians FD-317 M1 TaxID=944289 RepID=A0A0D0AXZ8_9AGAR|nr:hypothetical protein GYMLUDRAFT_47682 [Collybiopsis luxurians FD-317 M1]